MEERWQLACYLRTRVETIAVSTYTMVDSYRTSPPQAP